MQETLEKPEIISVSTGVGAVMEDVPIDLLRIDMSYQRWSPTKLEAMIRRGYVEEAMHPIVSNRRTEGDNRLRWVLDGHHRVKLAEHFAIATLPSYTYSGLSVAKEAEIFTLLNTWAIRANALERFKGRLMSGDPVALDLQRIIEDEGYFVDLTRTKKAHGLCAVVATEGIYARFGPERLAATLRFVHTVWPDAYGAIEETFLKAINWMLYLHVPVDVSWDEAVERAGTKTVNLLRREGRERGKELGVTATVAGTYRALVDTMNGMRRKRVIPYRSLNLRGEDIRSALLSPTAITAARQRVVDGESVAEAARWLAVQSGGSEQSAREALIRGSGTWAHLPWPNERSRPLRETVPQEDR